jgi:hypothetical protein
VRKKDTLYDYRTKFTSEEDARYAALKAEYSLDKFAKAKPIDFERWEKETTEHETLKDKLQKEIRDTEAEQLRYEHAGRRTLDPLQSMGGKRISDQPRRSEADLPKPIYRGQSLGLGRPHDRTAALSAPTKAEMAEYGMVPKKLVPKKLMRKRLADPAKEQVFQEESARKYDAAWRAAQGDAAGEKRKLTLGGGGRAPPRRRLNLEPETRTPDQIASS